jgi:poly-gamma-glutamate synthesis protein (capsule biosynthesis protein)
LGADVVVGHHPHVAENYELFEDGKAIFYSLGNFIFDTDYQRAHPYTDVGILLKLIFTEEKMTFEAIGTRIIRGPERIDTAPLPDIFTNIPAEEYVLLAPLAAKGFIVDEKRKMVYLNPEKYANYTQELWDDHILNGKLEEYTEGAHMDGDILNSLAFITDCNLNGTVAVYNRIDLKCIGIKLLIVCVIYNVGNCLA